MWFYRYECICKENVIEYLKFSVFFENLDCLIIRFIEIIDYSFLVKYFFF